MICWKLAWILTERQMKEREKEIVECKRKSRNKERQTNEFCVWFGFPLPYILISGLFFLSKNLAILTSHHDTNIESMKWNHRDLPLVSFSCSFFLFLVCHSNVFYPNSISSKPNWIIFSMVRWFFSFSFLIQRDHQMFNTL